MRAWERAQKLREIPTRNRKLTSDRAGPVWPRSLERDFRKSFAAYHRECKQSQASGQNGIRSQNDWIANNLYSRTGFKRTGRQVSSHLQQLRTWFKTKYRDEITWDEHVLTMENDNDSDSDGERDDDDDDDDDDETPPSLLGDSDSESTICDSPAPPLSVTVNHDELSLQTHQAEIINMNTPLAGIPGFEISWTPGPLYDELAPAVPPCADIPIAPQPAPFLPTFEPFSPFDNMALCHVELSLAPASNLYAAAVDVFVPAPQPVFYQPTMGYADEALQYAPEYDTFYPRAVPLNMFENNLYGF